MAGMLDVVYSIAVLLIAVVGIAFVFTRSTFAGSNEATEWSRWGELVAVAVFLVAMAASMLLTA